MKKTSEEKNIKAWEEYFQPWWWVEQFLYHPETKIEYEVEFGGSTSFNNYYQGFRVVPKSEKYERGFGIRYRRTVLADFIEMAHYDRFMVGEGWGVSLDMIEDDNV